MTVFTNGNNFDVEHISNSMNIANDRNTMIKWKVRDGRSVGRMERVWVFHSVQVIEMKLATYGHYEKVDVDEILLWGSPQGFP